jgi:predicted DNA-binding transcriptional regulator YafY
VKQYAVLSSYTGLKAEIMQINRIFGITYLLLNHEHMTAKMLSESSMCPFAIYRDIDRMSQLRFQSTLSEVSVVASVFYLILF